MSELTCTVCLDRFTEPKVLPCCHTFCKGCLERLLEKSKEKEKLVCPQCRAEHKVPQNGPGRFLTDFTLTHELEKAEISKIERKSVACGECESSDPAVSYCSDCQAFLCQFCSSAHKRMKVWRNHRVLPLDSLSEEAVTAKPVVLYCSQHPDEPLKVYCKDCVSLVCCRCIVASHQGHKLASVDGKTRKEVEAELNALVRNGQQKLMQLELNLQYIQHVEEIALRGLTL